VESAKAMRRGRHFPLLGRSVMPYDKRHGEEFLSPPSRRSLLGRRALGKAQWAEARIGCFR